MPEHLYSGTAQSVDLIVMNKNKKDKIIKMLDLTQFKIKEGRYFNRISIEGLKALNQAKEQSNLKKSIYREVNFIELKDYGYALNPYVYLKLSEIDRIPLKSLGTLIRGLKTDQVEFVSTSENNNLINYVNVSSVTEDGIQFAECKKIINKKEWIQRCSLKENDILLINKSFKLNYIYITAIDETAVINDCLTIIRIDPKVCHPYLFYEYLKSEDGIKNLNSITSISTVRVISTKRLNEMKVPKVLLEKSSWQIGEQLLENRLNYELQKRELLEKYEKERTFQMKKISFEGNDNE